MTWLEREREYMEYLDEIFCEGYGLLLAKGDPIAFEIGFNEWEAENYPEAA